MGITAAAQPIIDRADRLINDQSVADFLARHAGVDRRARDAADWLVKEHPTASEETLSLALSRVLQTLVAEKLSVFFSYKSKDKPIALRIADRLQRWSAGKLKVKHMADFGVEDVGRPWRERIETIIPQCDWFLLLLPTPGDERDWQLFEAGYFFRGQGLAGRLVCLHHPDNQVADALGAEQSVPAEVEGVQNFLEGLFKRPNWIPGMPPVNEYLDELESKAREIVDLIKPPAGPGVRSWCGAHMEVAFEDACAVRGWEELALGTVIDSNQECRRLFGLEVPRRLFGDWFAVIEGTERDVPWVRQLACAIRAAGEGRRVLPIAADFGLADGMRVRPAVCAVRRRKNDNSVEAVDILFNEAELKPVTSTMKPELAALSITLEFAVRFRYQILEQYAHRKLEGKDVLAFNKAMNALVREAMRDRRFAEDPTVIRQQTLALFVGADKTVVQTMYERSDQLWRKDGEGEMDRAIGNLDGEALSDLINELLDINQRFLGVTSRCFAALVADS